MKSAGNVSSNSCEPWRGWPRCAKGIAPESNQQSSTSGTRRITPPQFSHCSVTSSMYGLCRSKSSLSPSSAAELTHLCCLHCSQTQNGSGVPQSRDREMAQSTLFSSQSPMRPVLTWAGTQLVFRLLKSSSALCFVVCTYQESSA